MSDYLDQLAQATPVIREHYGTDPDKKPNDHCNWENVGLFNEMWEWVENDAHFRDRIKSMRRNG